MRNLKKFLALVLAMMMVFSLMITVSAKSLDDYSDKDTVNQRYAVAVDVLAQLGILQGQGNNSIAPKATLTRAEAATVVYRVITGDVEDDQVSIWESADRFDDLDDFRWAAGYINYAAVNGYVVGVGGSQFNPGATITGYEVLTMMLRAVGYGRNGEYQGSGWDTMTLDHAATLGFLKGIAGSDLNLGNAITREVMAQIIYNAMQTELVTWTGLTYSGLKKDLIDLDDRDTISTDEWGVPVVNCTATWNRSPDSRTGKVSIAVPMVIGFDNYMEECDVYDAIDDIYGLTEKSVQVGCYYVDGLWYDDVTPDPEGATESNTIIDTNTNKYVGHRASHTEVYYIEGENENDSYAWIVERSTYLAKVGEAVTPEADHNLHTREDYTTFYVYTGYDAPEDVNGVLYGYAVDSSYEGKYVLVNYNRAQTKSTADDGVLNVVEVADPENLELAVVQSTALIDGYVRDHETKEKVGLWDNLPGTTTVDDEYDNAWQFNLGRDAAMAYDPDEEVEIGHEKYYSAITDESGEIIYGLVADNDCGWLIIDRIKWNHPYGDWDGYAMADVYYAEGGYSEKITINSITPFDSADGAQIKMSGDTFGNPNDGKVSDNENNNQSYYNHLFWYTKGADNSLNLFAHPEFDEITDALNSSNGKTPKEAVFEADGSTEAEFEDFPNSDEYYADWVAENDVDFDVNSFLFYDLTDGSLAQNGHQIKGKDVDGKIAGAGNYTGTDSTNKTSHTTAAIVRDYTGIISVSDHTVFLIKEEDGKGYKFYTGTRKDIPDVNNAEICVVVDADTQWALVVAVDASKSKDMSDRYKIAYVATPYGNKNAGSKIDVYWLGETKATTITLSGAGHFANTGLYLFEKQTTGTTTYKQLGQTDLGASVSYWNLISSPRDSSSTETNYPTSVVKDTYFIRGVVDHVTASGRTMQLNRYSAAKASTAAADKFGYSLTSGIELADINLYDLDLATAKVIKVTKTTVDGTDEITNGDTISSTWYEEIDETAGKLSAIKPGMMVVVVYEKDGDDNYATVVYYYEVDAGETKGPDTGVLDLAYEAGNFNDGTPVSAIYNALDISRDWKVNDDGTKDYTHLIVTVPRAEIVKQIANAQAGDSSHQYLSALPYLTPQYDADTGNEPTAGQLLVLGFYLGGLEKTEIKGTPTVGTDYTIKDKDGNTVKAGDGTDKEFFFGDVKGDVQDTGETAFVYFRIGEVINSIGGTGTDTISYSIDMYDTEYTINIKLAGGGEVTYTVEIIMD